MTDRDNTSAADIIRIAVQSGIVLDWAKIAKYDDDLAHLWLRRRDTDGARLRCYPKQIRKAIERAPRIGALSAADSELVAIGRVRPGIADILVQVAVIGQPVYEPIPKDVIR